MALRRAPAAPRRVHGRPAPAASAADAAVDLRRRRRGRARRRARARVSRSLARKRRRAGCRSVAGRATAALRTPNRGRHVHGGRAGQGTGRAAESRRGGSGPVAAGDRVRGAPGQHGPGAGERQCLGNGDPGRAGPRLRARRRRVGTTGDSRSYARLRLHGRRGLRRTRRSTLRRDVEVSGRRGRGRQPRCDRRNRACAAAARRRRATLAVACARAHRGNATRGGARNRAPAPQRLRAAARPGLSAHARRTGPLRRSRDSRAHVDDGGRAPRHPVCERAVEPGAARGDGPCRPEPAQLPGRRASS